MPRSPDQTTIGPPSGGTEVALLEILRKHLADEEIGPDDDFYAMGGDSLTALRVVADAKEQGITITLRDLLYYPTARELAAAAPGNAEPTLTPSRPGAQGALAAATGLDAPFALLCPADRALAPAGVVDAFPASALQLGIIYQCEATGDPGLYHALIGMEVTGRFDEALFRSSLSVLFARHAALRTSFDLGSFSAPVQLIWSSVTPPLDIEWLETTDTEKTAKRLHAWRERELATAIDWARPPLARCHVVARPGSFSFGLAIHHAIVDGWSYARLIVDLLATYDALLRGRDPGLRPLPSEGYREFVEAEREAVGSAASAEFWQAEADAPPLIATRSRFAPAANAVDNVEFEIDAAALGRLRVAARRSGTSLKCMVHGALARALGEWSGRDQNLVMGVAVNTRPESADSELLMGLFLNTVPMRFPVTRGTWAELARQALDAERCALPHHRFPLVEIEKRLGRPAFDASFNFANFHVYRELAALREIRTGPRWVVSKPGFPLLADVEVDEEHAGARVIIEFDLAVIDPARAGRLAQLYQAALTAAGTDPDAVAEIDL